MLYPKISIVTPSFNQGDYLEETIVSVLSQNYPNLEYILIDGGSTDNSLDIINKYKASFTYWVSEKDSGQSEALNKGMRKSTGEILTWLNSDDVYMPGVLQSVAKHFQDHPETFLLHGKSIIFGKVKKEEVRGAPADDLEARYLAYIPFPQPSSFYRRQVLAEQGYLDENLHYGMDFDLLARIALNYNIDRSEEIYSRYRIHETSKSNNALGFVNDWNIVFSRILRSLAGNDEKIEFMKAAGIYVAGSQKYNVGKFPAKDVIDRAYVHFLKGQAQMYYIAGETGKSKLLFAFLKNNHQEFYKYENLKGLHRRASFFTPSILKLLRSIKGS